MNISSNISSIQSNQTFMNANANNIANASKQGSQVDLSKEMTDQIVGENVNAVNVSAIKAQDETLGSLLDIKA